VHVINEAIVQRAEDLGISQAELARRLDVRPQAVNKWFHGENVPERSKWPVIERVLDFKPGHLARLADGQDVINVEVTIPDVVTALRRDGRLDEHAQARVIAAYRLELEQAAGAARCP